MSITPEGAVKRDIKRFLVARGYWFFMPVPNGMGASGVPDFIVCAKGRFLGIEAKAPGKRANTTPMQDIQIEAINKAGGVALVVDDVKQLEDLCLAHPDM